MNRTNCKSRSNHGYSALILIQLIQNGKKEIRGYNQKSCCAYCDWFHSEACSTLAVSFFDKHLPQLSPLPRVLAALHRTVLGMVAALVVV